MRRSKGYTPPPWWAYSWTWKILVNLCFVAMITWYAFHQGAFLQVAAVVAGGNLFLDVVNFVIAYRRDRILYVED